jgi:hypothetical protein
MLDGAVLDGAALSIALALACFFLFGAVSAAGAAGGALVSCWASASAAVSTAAIGTASPWPVLQAKVLFDARLGLHALAGTLPLLGNSLIVARWYSFSDSRYVERFYANGYWRTQLNVCRPSEGGAQDKRRAAGPYIRAISRHLCVRGRLPASPAARRCSGVRCDSRSWFDGSGILVSPDRTFSGHPQNAPPRPLGTHRRLSAIISKKLEGVFSPKPGNEFSNARAFANPCLGRSGPTR